MSIELIRTLKRRRGGPPELLAYRERRRWREVRSDDINEYLKEHLGEEVSAKDFRTWNATVIAAVTLAADGRDAESKTARKRGINEAVRSAAELLGNTPAMARRSYIDPRVSTATCLGGRSPERSSGSPRSNQQPVGRLRIEGTRSAARMSAPRRPPDPRR